MVILSTSFITLLNYTNATTRENVCQANIMQLIQNCTMAVWLTGVNILLHVDQFRNISSYSYLLRTVVQGIGCCLMLNFHIVC